MAKTIDMKVKFADTFLKRLKGLMFTSSQPETPLLLVPGSRVHSCFMKFAIDVVYLDKNNVILGKEKLNPWKLGTRIKNTAKILEGSVGFAENFENGDILNFK
ncbi:MAG: DUF192 domain-containing protein [Candidatus Alkaliphilus sp. MAG34]|nr:DUF192 domain-containing protein [Clostridiales bacterium]